MKIFQKNLLLISEDNIDDVHKIAKKLEVYIKKNSSYCRVNNQMTYKLEGDRIPQLLKAEKKTTWTKFSQRKNIKSRTKKKYDMDTEEWRPSYGFDSKKNVDKRAGIYVKKEIIRKRK